VRFRTKCFACWALTLLASGCASSGRPAPTATAPLAAASRSSPREIPGQRALPLSVASLGAAASRTVDSGVQQASFVEPQPEPLPGTASRPADVEILPASYPIDLPTALRLANADAVQINLAREQIQQAYAEYNAASALWLPSLRSGVHWNKHEGPLLSSSGNLVNTSRSSLYAGMGAQAVGGGSPAVPGIFANFNFSDAYFLPLAAQQRWGARESGATATRNNILLDVSIAYLDLLRASADVAILQDIRDKLAEISRLTDAYAKTGQGLQADADRMRVEVGLRDLDLRRSQEQVIVASARLAQLLRLGPCVKLEPADSIVVRLCCVPIDCGCAELVAQALENRPELLQNRYLVGEAVQRLRRERFAPLVPSVLLGASYGGFGGGMGGNVDGWAGRFDFDASAFWEVRNLGFGEAAAQQSANSRLRQAQIQELGALDQVAREVTEAFGQVEIRTLQIETARQVVKEADNSYDLNFVRIKNAQGLPIEVLQSTLALLQARREYLRTIVDYNAAQFTLQRALGWPVGGPELSGPALPPG
jgi:outer membrane protein TolC